MPSPAPRGYAVHVNLCTWIRRGLYLRVRVAQIAADVTMEVWVQEALEARLAKRRGRGRPIRRAY